MADLFKVTPLCQGFLYNIVQLVGIGTESVITFIYRNHKDVFTKLPSSTSIISAILAGLAGFEIMQYYSEKGKQSHGGHWKLLVRSWVKDKSLLMLLQVWLIHAAANPCESF